MSRKLLSLSFSWKIFYQTCILSQLVLFRFLLSEFIAWQSYCYQTFQHNIWYSLYLRKYNWKIFDKTFSECRQYFFELLAFSAELIFFTAELSLFLERSFDFSAGAPFVEMPPRKWVYFWRFRVFCSIFRKKDRKLIFHYFSLFFDILDMSTQIFMIIIDWYLFIFIYKQFH